jgi:hypothetical protein
VLTLLLRKARSARRVANGIATSTAIHRAAVANDRFRQLHLTPAGVAAISRGLSEAISPVRRLQADLHPGRGASTSVNGSALKIIAGRARLCAATRPGVDIHDVRCTGDVAALDPRLIAMIPPGSKGRPVTQGAL